MFKFYIILSIICIQPLIYTNNQRKTRVLYFIVKYPTFSETYMHEEIRSLYNDYDIRIITYNVAQNPREQSFPYQVIPYRDSCLVYGPIEKVNQHFTNKNQQEFLQKVNEVIEEFKPDIMHGHYFGLSLLLRTLAEIHHIPFTLRTHSMDILSEPPQKIAALCNAANSPWCLRILTYPAFKDFLINNGLHPEKVCACWPVIHYQRFYNPEKRKATKRIMCTGPAIPKKAHTHFIDLALLMHDSTFTFDLYARGNSLKRTKAYNAIRGNPINIMYADPDEMHNMYLQYDWLVYPSDTTINKVGLPVSIAEAQASGIGICWQELPGRREEQLAFLGGAGFLFKSIDELPAILNQPFPEEMRLRGLENAKKCDIEEHKTLLTELWDHVVTRS